MGVQLTIKKGLNHKSIPRLPDRVSALALGLDPEVAERHMEM